MKFITTFKGLCLIVQGMDNNQNPIEHWFNKKEITIQRDNLKSRGHSFYREQKILDNWPDEIIYRYKEEVT